MNDPNRGTRVTVVRVGSFNGSTNSTNSDPFGKCPFIRVDYPFTQVENEDTRNDSNWSLLQRYDR